MDIKGQFMMSILVACTTTPLFSPEIMKDVERDTLAFKVRKGHEHRAGIE